MIEKVSLVILFMSVDVKNPANIGGHLLVPYPELKDLSSLNKDFIFRENSWQMFASTEGLRLSSADKVCLDIL